MRRHAFVKDRITDAALVMSPAEIRIVAEKMDELTRHYCPEGCRPDLVIGGAIDHLYAMAAAEEARSR